MIFGFVKFMTARKGRIKKISPSSFLFLLDPESGMEENQDPGKISRIRNTSEQCWGSVTFWCGSGSNSGTDSFLH
jgi:hypothetical protein